jgi:hypothetical protein
MNKSVVIKLNPNKPLCHYKLTDPQKKRRNTLILSSFKYGILPVLRRVVVLRTFRKSNKKSRAYKVLDDDVKYLQKLYKEFKLLCVA